MPLHFDSPLAAQAWCQRIRDAGKQIGFIATMGALHAGHVSLFERAQAENDVVIASIFVNPLQFNKTEDLKKYPRKNAEDLSLLDSIGVEAVFTGTPEQVLGDAENKTTEALADPGEYAKGLEGVYRPGHFAGVREVVSRLFSFVGPCRAYFGEKDFQQVKIIQQLAANMVGIQIVPCATSRQASGLARSSRNFRLSDNGIEDAAVIFKAMQAANTLWKLGERQPTTLQTAMLNILDKSIIDLEYADIRDPDNWTAQQPAHDLKQARAFIAGNIEGVRLIDNMALT
jgi:pantoate--beta-alanine ligase